MFKKLTLLTAASMLAAGSASAALLVHYDFDSLSAGALADGATITNLGSSGNNGTVGGIGGGTLTVVSGNAAWARSGNHLSFQPSSDGIGDVDAPHINTNGTIGDLNIAGDQNYTMGGFFNIQTNAQDNMAFGQSRQSGTGQVLHLGGRGDFYKHGHWGDDIDSSDPIDLGNWHHVVFTNTAGTNEQRIYVDGLLNGGPAGAGASGGYTANAAVNLLIGTSGNSGSYRGLMDDVRVYDEVLSDAQILAWSVPEPSGAALLGLAGFALMFRRRR